MALPERPGLVAPDDPELVPPCDVEPEVLEPEPAEPAPPCDVEPDEPELEVDPPEGRVSGGIWLWWSIM